MWRNQPQTIRVAYGIILGAILCVCAVLSQMGKASAATPPLPLCTFPVDKTYIQTITENYKFPAISWANPFNQLAIVTISASSTPGVTAGDYLLHTGAGTPSNITNKLSAEWRLNKDASNTYLDYSFTTSSGTQSPADTRYWKFNSDGTLPTTPVASLAAPTTSTAKTIATITCISAMNPVNTASNSGIAGHSAASWTPPNVFANANPDYSPSGFAFYGPTTTTTGGGTVVPTSITVNSTADVTKEYLHRLGLKAAALCVAVTLAGVTIYALRWRHLR